MIPLSFSPRSSGFTLVEFLLALLLGALIMLGAWVAYSERMEISQAQKTVRAIVDLNAMANRTYTTSNAFTSQQGGGTTPTMARLEAVSGTLPEGVVVHAGTPSATYTNYWGGSFAVTVGNSDGILGVHKDLLVFTLTALPPQVCINVATNLAAGVYDTRVNGTLVGLTPAATLTAANRNSVRYEQTVPLCSQQANQVVVRILKDYSYAQMRYQPFLGTMNAAEVARVTPNYNRVETALAAREAAQLALP